MKIGNIEFSSDLVLAPMSGVTNSAFRRLIRKENGSSIGLVVTEFISIEGLTREIPQTLKMLQFKEEERPISIQIFGYDISKMRDSALMVQDAGADIVDINCGCPVPKVVRRGGGCELMRQSNQLKLILEETRKAVSIPLTLKIRAGWDEKNKNALEIALMAQDCGVDMLAIHGRTRTELYRGQADWELIAEVASRLKIPVVGSGDVVDFEFAKKARSLGVSGLMIGRGAISNPWIFKEIESSNEVKIKDLEVPRVIKDYMSLLLEELPPKAVIGRMKQMCSQATRKVSGSTDVRRALCLSNNLEDMKNLLDNWQTELNQKRAA